MRMQASYELAQERRKQAGRQRSRSRDPAALLDGRGPAGAQARGAGRTGAVWHPSIAGCQDRAAPLPFRYPGSGGVRRFIR